MAMAPEQTGIGIRRHFTTEGVDPYDEVAWDRRDARITSYRDGSVAFEQRDVEVPASWSQNATNILAQKYFRGPLGSPERERSVRQVIDRVVTTIWTWGVKDGYFADEAEAEAFRAELTHLVVTQKAAFNSPVWFNIGVRGEPQQASACQPYDALVSTPDGLVPIGRLVEQRAVGAKVFDSHGLTKVVAVKANGQKPVLRLHTSAGFVLDVTADHLVWRSEGDGRGRFVAAGEIRPGDSLEWHRTDSWGDGEISRGRSAEAALAGWLQAAGFVGEPSVPDRPGRATRNPAAIEAITVSEAERRWVLDAMDAAFPGLRPDEWVTGVDAGLDRRRLRIEGPEVAAFLGRWGLGGRTIDTGLPEPVLTAPLPVAARYLRSLFQAAGFVSPKQRGCIAGLALGSEGLVRGVQALLLRFGIFSRIRYVSDRRPGQPGAWVLNVPVTEVRRFADEIGFVDPVKSAELAPGKAAAASAPQGPPDTRELVVGHIEQLGPMDVYDIQTESGEYLSGNIRVHNCFILAVDDTMQSILNWYVEEGTIFKGGSGSGINLSTIRSSQEPLKGGGLASGPVSFMRGADASAGTIKSGGKTRRAAKMVILNADHPDVEDFIWCKAVEERKARVLRDAGFDMDLDGKDSHSTQYQNANNSVRVTDEFMQAVLDDADWPLRAVTTGEPLRTVKARHLFRQIAEAAWECADPGMQFDTTINRWHTAAATGRINASNPCFPGDQLVHTDKGLIRFDELFDRARGGEAFGVYTHDATNPEAPAERVEITRPEALMITGWNEIVRLRFDNGAELRCTPNHRLFTVNRGWVQAADLTSEDDVKVLDLPAPPISADRRLPVSTDARDYLVKGDWARSLRLPEKWTDDFAHYLGWLVGDGCIAGDVVTTVYGNGDDQEHILPRHLRLLAWMNGDRPPKPSVQANGTTQLRQSRRAIARFLESLGISHAKAGEKSVPWSIEQAPPDAVAAFLRGLFDADGCVYDGRTNRYVGLGSSSRALLGGVQRLLSTFGIISRIYATQKDEKDKFLHARKDGSVRIYISRPMYDLRIANADIATFADTIGFDLPYKRARLERLLAGRPLGRGRRRNARLVERTDDGVELTYNLTEPRNHSYIVQSLTISNCSEYMHLDNSACNLASINLLKFLGDDGTFDVDGFKQAVEVVFTAQEILVGNADYPTARIAETSRRFRQLGLGYANLGAMLMALGLPYDSDEGRAWAGAVTALMTGHAYATSARTASRMGPFAGYMENKESTNRVLRMHRDAAAEIDDALVPADLLAAARDAWDRAVEGAEQFGVRNSQASVLAPTGTIGLLMDCDTTGIEPDLSLCKLKKLVGGGTMTIVNQTVPRALRRLGYTDDQVANIVTHIDEHKSIIGAPHLAAEHQPVFACSMGDNVIHYLGHVRMMSAVQPFISGAISKTINMPETATVEEVEQLHIEAWRLGLKAVAIYRDNCKVAQPLSTARRDVKAGAGGANGTASTAASAAATAAAVLAAPAETLVQTVVVREPVREKLPRKRLSKTFSFRVADCHGYVTVGEYDDGRPGEIFLKVAKQGSTLAGIMDAFAISVSHGLQYGVPLKAFVEMYTNMRFEPAGMTDDPDIRFASSLVDYIFRRLAVEYLPLEERAELGILTVGERMQPTLPGVEEAATPTSTGVDVVPDPAPPRAPKALGPAPTPAATDAARAAATPTPQAAASDAPYCYQCGMPMQRAGACFVCSSCGTTSGCS
jgi:ribonucleotide reductase alpha subunit